MPLLCNCQQMMQQWNCPVIFYTGTKYDSSKYEQMVAFLEGVIMSVINQNRIGVYGYEYNYKKTS